jgi:hypothetical protein
MHFLQALLLWFFISGFAIGGALAFHQFFPEESPWFGFIVPPLALVILLNFLEHFVPLPNLLFLFPLLAGGLIWLVARPGYPRRDVLLPAGIFLGSFAFTYLIRCLQPDILPSSDGLSDLNKINNFCQGCTLPPIDSWLPPFHYVWYYSLQHYAASIIKRLFEVELGVGYNAAHAFLSAMTCVAAAGAAYRLSGGRVWVTIAIPFLIASAATGTSAFIHLTMQSPSMWYANNISGGAIDYDTARAAGHAMGDDWFWKWIAQAPYRERLELQAPGFWIWREEYHANASGHLLTLLAVFIIAELVSLRRTAWPWILAVLTPILAVDASTWAYPITGLLCGGTVVFALWAGRRPASPGRAALILLAALVLLWPSLYDVTSSPEVPSIIRTKTEWLAPWREFIVQWWPIILLWIYGCCLFRQISFGLRWILFVIPLMLIGVELFTIEGRYNTVEKMWGYTYGLGLFAFFPIIAARSNLEEVGACLVEQGRAFGSSQARRFPGLLSPQVWVGALVFFLIYVLVSLLRWGGVGSIWAGFSALFALDVFFCFLFYFVASSLRREDWNPIEKSIRDFFVLLFRPAYLLPRFVTLLLLFSAAVALFAWIYNTVRWAPRDGLFHLEGDHYLVSDDQKKKIIHVLKQVKRATFLSGEAAWCYNESPAPAVFTGNRSYSAWFYFESVADYPEEAEYRSKLNNDFYSGAMTDPLGFLHANDITGVVIWPDDVIPDDYLATLRKELAPTYDYIDCRGDGPHNAGVFLLRPLPAEVRLR